MNPRTFFTVLAISLAHAFAETAELPRVEQWGRFELNLAGPSIGNPFIEIELTARFTQENTDINVTGF